VAAPGCSIASDAASPVTANRPVFVLDLDKTIPCRAFALADPYRVIVDIPQVRLQAHRWYRAEAEDWSRRSATAS